MKVTKLLFQEQHPLGVTWSDPLSNCYPYLIVILTHLSSLPTQNISKQVWGLQQMWVMGKDCRRWACLQREVGWMWLLLGKAWDVVINFPSWSIRVWVYLTQLPWVKKTPGCFSGGTVLEQCSAVAHGWCWNPIFSVVFCCVSTFGARSGSAALETVVFDFHQACLTHFWGCCVFFPLHHLLVCEKPSFLLGVTSIQTVPCGMLFNYFSLCLPNAQVNLSIPICGGQISAGSDFEFGLLWYFTIHSLPPCAGAACEGATAVWKLECRLWILNALVWAVLFLFGLHPPLLSPSPPLPG